MNHKTKSFFFKIVSFLPNKIGFTLYYFFQNSKQSNNFELKLKSAENTFKSLIALCNQYKINIKNATVLEIGSGWVPSLPYLFLFKGNAKKVLTYDINNHYQKNNLKKFNHVFEKTTSIFLNVGKNELPQQVDYFPKTDVINCKDTTVSIVFSRFVLEHVKPEDMLLIHENFKKNFKKGTYIIHFVSPSDHRAYSDHTLSLQDFLKYSQKEWNKIQTKFDYHNRLRFSEYVKIFESLDIEILHQSYDVVDKKSNQYLLFKALKLDKHYDSYSEDDLLAGNLVFVLKL
ncbi:hypothetical protein [Flavobacterium sp. J27]|uniref:hypothetical protein n=1 Tax=Flavobacterium sp. J27 TaxID=2060419 RepID=UPI001031ACCC|nr:hypothetical protein [Flavobacterium sp. J27]